MNSTLIISRSMLHAIDPIGKGTAEIESLVSFLCRLSESHAVSTLELTRQIAKYRDHNDLGTFKWFDRNIVGSGESARLWVNSLSAMTSVQKLENLTFLPWSNVIPNNRLSLVREGQFCTACFADDLKSGRKPYFRLLWESSDVLVCIKHQQKLTKRCSSCLKENVRHSAAYVIPGWCTRCREFLGKETCSSHSSNIDPIQLWCAQQIGELFANLSKLTVIPSQNDLMNTILTLVNRMDSGQYSHFANRLGISKSTVHHWFKKGGTPTLSISLKIAWHCGLSLVNLLTGNLDNWQPPNAVYLNNLGQHQPTLVKRAPSRKLDWQAIEQKLHEFLLLPIPISVNEAARRLKISARQLYAKANLICKKLGQRRKDYRRQQIEMFIARVKPILAVACQEIHSEGKAVNHREIMARVPKEIWSSISNMREVLDDVQKELKNPDVAINQV